MKALLLCVENLWNLPFIFVCCFVALETLTDEMVEWSKGSKVGAGFAEEQSPGLPGSPAGVES